ncbi:hypothetical protein SAMN02745704_01433 [Paucidesulfovibrio gracilis DSM 16080]|uniref:Uncharacterized protein n=1 Tax=Paucidesulfovibrio gracilis DSM 16080 TaxID=1121449 RepID=A0A1T4WVZ8_9BACT|nr:hypothetical protein [Paucidesulfovibrio gracilis]SKA81045.1 hypothetical protein SAMN02745704_01433 [Paucidesulfovibrio gracilis DSM 16080]
MNGRIILFTAGLLLSVLLPCLVAADAGNGTSLEGNYVVEGWNTIPPDGPPDYAGTGRIWSIGATYLFEADIDGQRYTGVGLLDPDKGVLALQFNGTDGNGLTVLKINIDNLAGSWVFSESPKELGWEVWTPTFGAP